MQLHFSQQSLQWVASGYLLTYGGFLLLGGRLADLLGRRRVLVAGLVVFAVCSLTAGLAQSEGTLIAARLLQGVGAAMMAPAALSILTTTFREGADRNTALGVWGAISGLAAAAGVFLGGVLAEGPGWRWVFYVNIPVCVLALGASFRLLPGERKRAPRADFDTPGALLATSGMLLLVYALIKAPDVGWDKPRTIATLAAAGPDPRRVRAQRASQPQPADAPLDLPGQGAGRGRRDMAARDGRFLRDVLLPHPLHAGGPRLLADPGRRRLPPRDGMPGARRRRLLATVRADRDSAGDRRRSAAERRRDLLPLEDPAARILRARRAPRTGDDGARIRRRVRRRHHRRQRRRPGRQGRPRRRPAEHLPATRDGARARSPVRDRHRPHPPPTRGPHGATRGAHLRLPARTTGLQHLRPRRGSDRNPHPKHPRGRAAARRCPNPPPSRPSSSTLAQNRKDTQR